MPPDGPFQSDSDSESPTNPTTPSTGEEASPHAPNRETIRKRRGKEPRIAPRWWLPLALLFSFGLHLILGYGAQRLGWFGTVNTPDPNPGKPIEVALRQPLPAVPMPRQETPEVLPPAPVPVAPTPYPTPDRRFENFIPPPVPRPQRPVPIPSTRPPVAVRPVVPRTPSVIARPPIMTPQRITRTEAIPRLRINSAPASGGPITNALPKPLPPGDLSGADTPGVTRSSSGPRSVAGPSAAKSTGPEPAETGGADPGGATRTTETGEKPASPGAGKNVADAGKGEGKAAGNATGTPSNALRKYGIDRGIPFGSKLGIYDGDPNGGGGSGAGPGGGSDASISRRDDGSVFVSLKRTAPPGGGPPVRVVYVIDVSESMKEGNKIGKAKEALRKALGELRPDDSFTILAFASHASRPNRLLLANRSNLTLAYTSLTNLEPVGASGTNFSEALTMALSIRDATHVIILSDGVPTMGETDPRLLLRDARELNTQRARLITMALLGPSDKRDGFDFLRDLAEQHQGRFDYVELR